MGSIPRTLNRARRVIRPEVNLIRAGKPFASKLNGSCPSFSGRSGDAGRSQEEGWGTKPAAAGEGTGRGGGDGECAGCGRGSCIPLLLTLTEVPLLL